MRKLLTAMSLFIFTCLTTEIIFASPTPPSLSVTTSGINVSICWSSVPDATGYIFYYAPFPFLGPDTILSFDIGNQTNLSGDLWDGAAFYVAVTATNNAGESGYSNIELIQINDPGSIRFSVDTGGYLVRQTSDDGYIIAGPSDYNSEISLTRTNRYGNEVWSRSGFKSIGAVQFLASVQQTFDGGYIIIGFTGSGQYAFDDSNDIFLIKTNAEGNEVWSKTFGYTHRDDEATSGQQTSDGGYIVVGMTSSGAPQYANVLLVKFNANGDKEWDKNFHFSYDDYAYSVQQTADGGYIIAGMTEQADYLNDMLWIKTDTNGNIVWHNAYDNPELNSYSYGPEAHSIRQTNDAGYIIGGSAIIKTGSDGAVEWVRNIDTRVRDAIGCLVVRDGSVQQTSDGGYFYCCGDKFFKTDANFNEIWSRDIGICPSQQTSDGGYIGVSSNYLIKTDENGDYQ